MMIIGCDFHPEWQQVCISNPQTGEITERRLVNGNGEAERFYSSRAKLAWLSARCRGSCLQI